MTHLFLSLVLIAQNAPWTGRLAFAGVFALLIVWLSVVPSSRLAEEDGQTAWWRRSRTWAILVAAFQMAVYLFWR